MLRAAIIFFVIALIAGALGSWNVAGISLEVGAVISFVLSLANGRHSRHQLP